MKRKLFIVAAFLVAVGFTPLVHADDRKGEGMMDKGMMHHGMMMKNDMAGGASMVATSDGGVVVLSGCTLTKYDKNLKVAKEVKMSCGMEKKAGCPMMKNGKMGMMDNNDGDDDDKAEAPASAADVDHASHH
jgi:hypothetical protein